MTLYKASFLSFIATIVKILSGLVINKAIAIYIGPTGLAIIGQFQNFSQVVMTLAQGGINTGVTKYTSEYGRGSPELPVLFSTAVRISVFASLIIGSCLIFFSNNFSIHFLKTDKYSYIFMVFGLTIFLVVCNNLLLSVINGLKEIKVFVAINITQSIYNLVFTSLLAVFFGLDGVLIALVTNQSIIFFVALWMLRKHPIINANNWVQGFKKNEAKKLFSYSLMTVTAVIVAPVSQLIVRNYIGAELGWEKAGYWQAIWYVSTMYLMVVTMTLSIYYLPKFSEITDKKLLKKELLQGYKLLLPIVIASSLIIYILRDFIIWFVFTEDFFPISDLFLWQLIGDVIKLASWLLAYLMLARAMIKRYIITEILFSISFVYLSILFVDMYGLVGVTYAFAMNYFFYFIIVFFLTKNTLFIK